MSHRRRRTCSVAGAITLAFLALAGQRADAAPLTIASYDVHRAAPSGFGGWSHEYTGTITPTGRTFGGSFGCPCAVVDETGGSGTLNDGVAPEAIFDNQLFVTRNDDAGVPISPRITIHLAERASITEIRLLGGDIPFNAFPGAITGATVQLGDATIRLTTIDGGTTDTLDLRGTTAAGVVTDTIVLTDVTAALPGFALDQFNIAEIQVDGTPSAVTAADLCARTHTLVIGSPRYQAAPPPLRQAADTLVSVACAALDRFDPALTAAQRNALLMRYKQAVDVLAQKGWLTAEQAAALHALADQLITVGAASAASTDRPAGSRPIPS